MFQLDVKSRKSIYEQVIDQLKAQIMEGALCTGQKLPSVRELSKSISVNPNTVQKAYRELERQGYIYTTSGVGTFVADKSAITADPKMLEKAKKNLEDAFSALLYLGIYYQDALNLTLEIIEKRRPTHD